MDVKTITALVPMRHHSQRVPGKNYRLLAGRPLYQHVITNLLEVKKLTQIVVDTDSDEIIAGIKQNFPTVKLIRRPEALCGDTISMNEILSYDVQQFPSDLYLQTHSTNPLVRTETFDRAIQTLLNLYPGYDSLLESPACKPVYGMV